MKYRIGNRVINSDHIVRVEYTPEAAGDKSECLVFTDEPYNPDESCPFFSFRGSKADAFWQAYSGDAYTVVA